MKKCENCNNEHNGLYGSGRFCSNKCAKSFSTKNKRKEINKKVSNTLKKEKESKVCPICNNNFIPKKKVQKLCSKSCVAKNRVSLMHESLKRNPPNWSEINKRSYENGNNYIAGGTTKWYKYKDIKVQGTYELRTCKILDRMVELKQIKSWEYTNDRLKYIGIDKEWHNYLLDFKVINNDNSFYYIETKGYHTENDLLKWKSVKDQGYEIIIWYNEEITNKEGELGI